MKQCKSDAVRQYVRKSMANAWDDAQGASTDASCPRIPKAIRQFYSGGAEKFEHYYSPKVFRKEEVKCAGSYTCTEKQLMWGGKASVFLTALFWASYDDWDVKKPCTLMTLAVDVDTDGWVTKEKRGCVVRFVVAALAKVHKIPFQVFDFFFVPGLTADTSRLELMLEGIYNIVVSRSMHVHGIILGLCDPKNTSRAHAVTLFPCTRNARLNWTFCNSWGMPCSEDLDAELKKLENKAFTQLFQLVLLIGTDSGKS